MTIAPKEGITKEIEKECITNSSTTTIPGFDDQ